MDENSFWKLVDATRREAEGDTDEQVALLEERLEGMSEADIVDFARHFERFHRESYHSSLWAAAYVINGGCSDDGFDYFRGWLVLQGPKVYAEALEDPDTLARVVEDEVECEDALYVAARAYEAKTGRELDMGPARGELTLRGDLADWSDDGEGDEQRLRKLVPKLTRKFWT